MLFWHFLELTWGRTCDELRHHSRHKSSRNVYSLNTGCVTGCYRGIFFWSDHRLKSQTVYSSAFLYMHVVHGFIQLSRMMSGNIRCLGVKGCLLRSKSLCPDDYRRVSASGATGPPVVIPSSSKTDRESSRGEMGGGSYG